MDNTAPGPCLATMLTWGMGRRRERDRGKGRGRGGGKEMGRGKGKGKGEGRGGDVLGLSMERKNVVLPRPPFQALCPRHTQTKHEHHQPTCMCTLCLTVCTHTQVYRHCTHSDSPPQCHPVPLPTDKPHEYYYSTMNTLISKTHK